MPGSGSSRTAEVSWLVVTRYASVDVSTCFNMFQHVSTSEKNAGYNQLVIPLGRWALVILLVVSHPTGVDIGPGRPPRRALHEPRPLRPLSAADPL